MIYIYTCIICNREREILDFEPVKRPWAPRESRFRARRRAALGIRQRGVQWEGGAVDGGSMT